MKATIGFKRVFTGALFIAAIAAGGQARADHDLSVFEQRALQESSGPAVPVERFMSGGAAGRSSGSIEPRAQQSDPSFNAIRERRAIQEGGYSSAS